MKANRLVGKAYTIGVLINCPVCTASLENMSGSAMITASSGYRAGQVVTCTECGEEYKLPGVVNRL